MVRITRNTGQIFEVGDAAFYRFSPAWYGWLSSPTRMTYNFGSFSAIRIPGEV